MTTKQSTAVTEFHKWLTIVGIPAVIVLQIDNRQKLEEMNLLLSRHDEKIVNITKNDESQDRRIDKIENRITDFDAERNKYAFFNKHIQ